MYKNPERSHARWDQSWLQSLKVLDWVCSHLMLIHFLFAI